MTAAPVTFSVTIDAQGLLGELMAQNEELRAAVSKLTAVVARVEAKVDELSVDITPEIEAVEDATARLEALAPEQA